MDNWLLDLPKLTPFRKYSQNGEEAILGHIFTNVGPMQGGHLIDLGAGDGYNLSNARWLMEAHGWTGLLIDGDPRGTVDVTKAWIDLKSVKNLIGRTQEPDLLLIDLDGNDYWILEEALKWSSPKVILAEINPALPPDEAWTTPYDPEHVFDNTDHHGMSLQALRQLGEANKYTLIHVQASLNAFLLRNDLVLGEVPPLKMERTQGHPHKPNALWVRL